MTSSAENLQDMLRTDQYNHSRTYVRVTPYTAHSNRKCISSSTWLQFLFSKGSYFQRPVSTLKLFVHLSINSRLLPKFSCPKYSSGSSFVFRFAYNLSFGLFPPRASTVFPAWLSGSNLPTCPTWPKPNCSKNFRSEHQIFLSPCCFPDSVHLFTSLHYLSPKSEARSLWLEPANPIRLTAALFSCSLLCHVVLQWWMCLSDGLKKFRQEILEQWWSI